MDLRFSIGTDIITDEKTGRSRSRRKIILNTPPKSKSEARSVPASRPRKRNAIGVERIAKMAMASSSRTVVISKSQNLNASGDVETALGLGDENQPDEKETSRNRGCMLVAIVVATLILGIFNSRALVNRVRGLPAGPVEDRIIIAAEAWHEWVENQGLGGYMDIARSYVASLKDKRWRDLKR